MSTIAPIIHSTYGMYLVRFVKIKIYYPYITTNKVNDLICKYTLKMIKYDYIMLSESAIYIQIEILAWAIKISVFTDSQACI